MNYDVLAAKAARIQTAKTPQQLNDAQMALVQLSLADYQIVVATVPTPELDLYEHEEQNQNSLNNVKRSNPKTVGGLKPQRKSSST
jgi:hypothetical protein